MYCQNFRLTKVRVKGMHKGSVTSYSAELPVDEGVPKCRRSRRCERCEDESRPTTDSATWKQRECVCVSEWAFISSAFGKACSNPCTHRNLHTSWKKIGVAAKFCMCCVDKSYSLGRSSPAKRIGLCLHLYGWPWWSLDTHMHADMYTPGASHVNYRRRSKHTYIYIGIYNAEIYAHSSMHTWAQKVDIWANILRIIV